MQIAQPALALLDVGLELVAAVADPAVALVALGELGLDELRRGAAHDLAVEALLQLGEQRLVAPQIARLEQAGADRQIGFGLAQAFLDRARRLADLEPEIPQQIEQQLDDLLGVRRLLVGQQKQQVDVGIGRQLAAAIAADRDQGQPLARGRVGAADRFRSVTTSNSARIS